jgi:hypothetical protein
MDQTRNVDISPAERSRLRVSRGKRTLRSSRRGHGLALPALVYQLTGIWQEARR